jgi:hypothetical protein
VEEEEQARRAVVSGEEEEEIVTTRSDAPIASENQRESSSSMTSEFQWEQPVQIEFIYNKIRDRVNKPKDVTSKQAALQKCHNRLNHMSFARIQAIAKHGLLPKYLADVEPPVCASCTYGKATRQPWKEKGASNKQRLAMVTRPGGCISVDQLESPTPGSVGQIKGWLTTKHYGAATVFAGHFPGIPFVYLQFSTNAEETVNAKKAFEAYAALQGVTIWHYHADSGCFAETKWLEAIKAHRPITNHLILWHGHTPSKWYCQKEDTRSPRECAHHDAPCVLALVPGTHSLALAVRFANGSQRHERNTSQTWQKSIANQDFCTSWRAT